MIIPPTFGSSPFSPANILSIVKLFIECSLTACLISLKISNFDDNKTLHMSSVFKIYSSEDCDFYYDGELQGHIEGNSDRAFRFEVERKGIYRLKFVNSEYKSELIQKVSIDAYEEREVELDFSEVNEPVIRERERIIIAIEHDYGSGERLPEEIISAISKNGIVTIPKGVRKIGEMAFYNYNSLTSVTIPQSITNIGAFAFYGCSNLTSVTIPDSVTSIGHRAFSDCSSLKSIIIPISVTSIGHRAFWGCSSLKNIIIPNSITEIGNCTFKGCSSLTSITIPNGITKIGNCTFKGCSSLTSITIPDSVTSIGHGAFSNCSSLTSVTIPDGVNEIESRAFSGCSSLTSVTIPDSVTSIGHWAFSNCSSLKSIIIPNSITKIGSGTFIGCSSLTSVTIPNSVTKIWICINAFYGCSSLKSVYCKSTTPPKLEHNTFYNTALDLRIYVPKSEGSIILKAYKSANRWKDYADIIEEYDFDNE